MPTFIVANDATFSQPIELNSDDEHHLTRVMRVRMGEMIRVTNNLGQVATLKVNSTNPLLFDVLKIEDGEAPAPITLCLPLIDQDRMEWAVEKLTELNIKTVQLMSTARTQSRDIKPNKLERLHKAALSAQKQCGRATPLEILAPAGLSQLLTQSSGAKIIASLAEGSKPVNELRLPKAQPKTIYIGPEGGFDDNEENSFIQQDFYRVSLGQTILRAETAAITLTSLVRFY